MTAPPQGGLSGSLRRAKPVVISLVVLFVGWFGITAAINTRAMQHRAACQANLKLIGRALTDYQSRYGAPPADLQTLADAGLVLAEILRCPLAPGPQTNYQLAEHEDVQIYEPLSNHRTGANILLSDGRATWVPQDQLHYLDLPIK